MNDHSHGKGGGYEGPDMAITRPSMAPTSDLASLKEVAGFDTMGKRQVGEKRKSIFIGMVKA